MTDRHPETCPQCGSWVFHRSARCECGKPTGKPFADVTFASEYPQHNVADHDVLLSFDGDSQAVAFHEWWGVEGAVAFGDWLRRNEGK